LSKDTVRKENRNGTATAAVGVARPEGGHGYFIERNGVSNPGEGGERLAREMVESSDKTGEPAESFNIEATATITGTEKENDTDDDPDEYTTAVALAVFIPPESITHASV